MTAEKKPPVKKKDEVEKAREETEKELKGTLKPGIKTAPLPQFINVSNFRFIDISSELFREYIYPNGAKLRIEYPMRLSVAKNNAHRVFDMNGLSYYIQPNWLAIVWKARPGTPNFIM